MEDVAPVPAKELKEFTNQEIHSFLARNYELPMTILGALCSEVLRRILDEDLKLISSVASSDASTDSPCDL